MSPDLFTYSEERNTVTDECVSENCDSGIEDDDDFDYEDIDDRFIMSSPEEDHLMGLFYNWLISVDGGLKPIRSAVQHRNVVMKVVHMLDQTGKDYSKLFSRSEMNLWVSYCENKKRKPGTIKTYLGSVKQFYDFLLVNDLPMLNVSAGEITKIKAIVCQWCRNYYKRIKIAKHEKQLEDLSRLPSPEEIRQLDTSDHRKEAIKLLSTFSCTEREPSRREFCLVRDYLLTYIILDNGSRSGCVANMILKEFRRAEAQSNGSYVISVMDHKTIASSGPAMLSINEAIMRHLRVFILKLRNKIQYMLSCDVNPVFPSWSGRRMDSSMVTTQLNTFWKNALGIDLERRICATLIRKMSTTVVHGNEPDLKLNLANLMNHDVRTAEREYFLQEKKKTVADTSARLRTALRTDYTDNVGDDELLVMFENEEHLNIDVIRKVVKLKPKLESYDEKKLYDKVIDYSTLVTLGVK